MYLSFVVIITVEFFEYDYLSNMCYSYYAFGFKNRHYIHFSSLSYP